MFPGFKKKSATFYLFYFGLRNLLYDMMTTFIQVYTFTPGLFNLTDCQGHRDVECQKESFLIMNSNYCGVVVDHAHLERKEKKQNLLAV